MKIVQPIREVEKIEEMKQVLRNTAYKNYLLFVMGINTGLRISDLLNLKVEDVKDRTHIIIHEKKTGKRKRFLINKKLKKEIDDFIKDKRETDYLFMSRKGYNQPISRIQAYRILNNAARACNIEEVGTHTLRKTFGAPKMGI